jgi:hypothetical protein
MALDDVVIRAMSKQPDDRFPSAGDLGRAAEAALRGDRVAVPERTVATGAAATRTAETMQPEPVEPTAETRVPAEPLAEPDAPGSTAATAVGEPSEPARKSLSDSPSGRRRLALGAALLGIVAIVIAAIALSTGGGEGGGGGLAATADTTAKEETAPQERQQKQVKPQPKTLSRSEMLRRADAICEDSQNTYKGVYSAFSEENPDVAYSATLVGISTPAIDRFRKLAPPPGMAASWGRYLAAQEQVGEYDREALRAAKAEDADAYRAAREKRDEGQTERYELARQLGLQMCSSNPG